MTLSSPPRQVSMLRAWVLAARPPTLPAAVVPVLVGTASAARQGTFHLLPALVALLGALLIQIGTNLANDYFDFQHGADTAERLGPVRVTQSGLLAPSTVLGATIGVFAAAAICGLYLTSVAGLPILLIGILSILAGVLYTGGPWPLAYHGLGDLFVFIFFGLIAVMGSIYVQRQAIATGDAIVALPVALLVTAILVVNNLRDIDTDRRARKYTLAVLLGRRFARIEYATCLIGAYLLLPGSWLARLLPLGALLPILTLPLAVLLLRAAAAGEGRSLNATLAGTGRLHMLFGLLLALGLLL